MLIFGPVRLMPRPSMWACLPRHGTLARGELASAGQQPIARDHKRQVADLGGLCLDHPDAVFNLGLRQLALLPVVQDDASLHRAAADIQVRMPLVRRGRTPHYHRRCRIGRHLRSIAARRYGAGNRIWP